MQLSQNICDVQNYGTRRYVCLESKGKFAYIDILEKDNEVLAFVQTGIHMKFTQSGSPYRGSDEAQAVHKAFESIKNSWLFIAWNPDNELEIPIVLKDYQLNIF